MVSSCFASCCVLLQECTSSSPQHNNKIKLSTVQIYVNVVLFPLHVSTPLRLSSGGPLIHLKLQATVTEFAKLSG
jgi:hypothetical protein